MSFISVFPPNFLSDGDRTSQVPRKFPTGIFAVDDTTGKEQSLHEAREAPLLYPQGVLSLLASLKSSRD